jgi:hypothetical protein
MTLLVSTKMAIPTALMVDEGGRRWEGMDAQSSKERFLEKSSLQGLVQEENKNLGG